MTILSGITIAQPAIKEKSDSLKLNENKPELFSSGFIDVMNNGQVNASARLIKLYIGEPGKFSIPISFYGGVSNNNFQQQTPTFSKSNDHLVNQYINPLSGLINISIDDTNYFNQTESVTKSGFIYRVGERVLNGVRVGPIADPRTGKATSFLNSFGFAGFLWQTGAWEKTNSKNIGVFWLAMRYHACYTNPKQIKEFLSEVETNGVYHGYSVGFGIEIDKVVNIKAIYYKYVKAPEIDYGFPIYQFTFNYTMEGRK
ncbi:MAG: hypothetical protein ABIT96_00195 [Ferruginibacter sp.]